ncbi:MAG: PspC domain-containing protein [Bacteroidetes bacterium]|nr:PspC domain-containing protein [Pelagibacterales bacterium]MDA0681748.1 PspC domain-containing protein [Bacteroidota bacterium]MDA0890178.1 PspC domain-containing protein [Bacteroidota bacterium]MDA1009643.1 PspC domain-containing protein [Bacteroidota bacterium]
MCERKILGVCAWLADKFGLDVGGLRILFVAASIFGFGSPIIIYFILYLLKPSNY